VGVGTVYRRFPEKEQLIDALFEDRVEEIAQVARDAVANPDPWEGLVSFLTRAQELQSEDRGLKEIVLGGVRGAERALAARSLIAPIVEQVFDKAKAAGAVRADVELSDLPLLQLAIGTLSESARDVAPDAWRRMMAIVLDGLRAECARTELPGPALEQEQVDAVMAAYGASRRRT
jgi:AcrR family transcriptional regulator